MNQVTLVGYAVREHLGSDCLEYKSGAMSDKWHRIVCPIARELDASAIAVLRDRIMDCGPVNIVIHHGSDKRRKLKIDCIIHFQTTD